MPVDGCWLGLVVPKRHARRSVTRNLLKRQMREVVAECAHALPAGLWVLRLKSPFDPRQFRSAASPALRSAARAELRQLLARPVRSRAVDGASARVDVAANPASAGSTTP